VALHMRNTPNRLINYAIAPGSHLGPKQLFNVEVTTFYENLVDVFDRYGFDPNHIFNVNESGFTNVQ
jgi:hypothetical protein